MKLIRLGVAWAMTYRESMPTLARRSATFGRTTARAVAQAWDRLSEGRHTDVQVHAA